MYVCMCVCVCMCVYMCVSVYIYVYVSVCTCMCVCVSVHVETIFLKQPECENRSELVVQQIKSIFQKNRSLCDTSTKFGMNNA